MSEPHDRHLESARRHLAAAQRSLARASRTAPAQGQHGAWLGGVERDTDDALNYLLDHLGADPS